jgi:hypothetical protein
MSMSPVMFTCTLTIGGIALACWLASKKSVFIDCIAGVLVAFVVVCVLLKFWLL